VSAQIKFFRRNKIDLTNTNCTLTVTDAVASSDGQSIVDFLRNRNNNSAWVTTDSTDAANTSIVIDIGDLVTISDILLVSHNFKSFKLEYHDGSDWADFPTPVDFTDCDETTTHVEVTPIDTSRMRLTIRGTQISNADKKMTQLIVTEKFGVGQFNSWPVIKNPIHGTNKRKSKMLSGKVNLIESVGSFSCELVVPVLTDDSDFTLLEALYFGRQGFLVWLCGGDEEQFSTKRIGYRKQDIYLMRPTSDYMPEYLNGVYPSGVKFGIKLEECIG
jgi:hypothetical protein